MHNEDYIASGILELYAAGGLSQAEREEVERRAAASPEVRMALDEACMAMENYATLHAVTPRPQLKDRILSQIEHSDSHQGSETVTENNSTVRPLYPETARSSPYKWMLAASVSLFLLTGFLSFHFYKKWQQAENRLADVIESEQLLAQNFRQTSLQLEQQQKTLSILRNPDFKLLELQGVETHTEASMLVYWNPDLQQVYVDNIALPAPPAGKQYQLWALLDGKPIDAGMIELSDDANNLQQMKDIGAAQAFAVTLEPAGGSEVPTLEQLTVMGSVDT